MDVLGPNITIPEPGDFVRLRSSGGWIQVIDIEWSFFPGLFMVRGKNPYGMELVQPNIDIDEVREECPVD